MRKKRERKGEEEEEEMRATDACKRSNVVTRCAAVCRAQWGAVGEMSERNL